MNLILFQSGESSRQLPLTDARARHLLTVLRRQPGDSFDAGLINGPRGKGTLVALTTTHLELAFEWEAPPPPPDPVTLLIGLPRPQTARKILQEAAALGVAALHFVRGDKAEPSYANSTLWSSGEWQRHLEAGAAQAFCTALPTLTHGQTLAQAISALPATATRLALDNYEAPAPLSQCHLLNDTPLVLAFGPERGWSAGERALLRAQQFTFAHLSERVLRLETAVVAALAITKAQRGLM
ncbi:MAG: 16S rRNA (uracil(1498)-N(3))-methyltransferase [Opitutaceae bacterium]|nr:16S rRNA (uracil(1498)-N(3))-methyltransferase [Opitutaceae bacterium]